MAATTQTLREHAARRAPSRRPDFGIRPGATLGYAPNRAAKELIAAGLRAMEIEARYIIERPSDGAFRVVTAEYELATEIAAARGMVRGILLALRPPDPLAAEVVTSRNEWSHHMNLAGRAVAATHFACGNPECVVTASVRKGDAAAAWGQLQSLGWGMSPTWGYVCPDHIGQQIVINTPNPDAAADAFRAAAATIEGGLL